MKIAISATGPSLDSDIDPRFGRCRYLMFADTDSDEFEAFENPGGSAGGGAGIATGQTVVDRGVSAVLTGNLGPNAHQVLEAARIRVMTGVSGTVRKAIERFKVGELTETTGPTVDAHHGMGAPASGLPTRDSQVEGIEELKSEVQSLRGHLDM